MTAPYAGGHTIKRAEWGESTELNVDFTTVHTTLHHQLYHGRQLVGVTETIGSRSISGATQQFDNPEEVQILAVDADDQFTDFGSTLPPRPYARVKLRVTTSGWASDTRYVQFSAGTEPGGAVDVTNILGNVPWVGNGTYVFITPPMLESGTWNFEAAGIDGTLPDGNRGTAIAISATVLVYPPDVLAEEFGPRLTATIDAGNLVVTFEEPA